MIITIEGNIGAGKSVYAELLYKYLVSQKFEVIHLKEPVNDWINFNGVNFLKMFYDYTERWAFAFQINAIFDAKDIESQAIKYSQKNCVVIMERSSFSALEIFCKHLSSEIFDPVETTIIEKIKLKIPKILENYKNNLVIYIKTAPDICMERMIDRSRKEEIGKIDLVYLQKLHELHEKSLNLKRNNCNLLTIDGSSYNKCCFEQAKLVGDETLNALKVLTDYLCTYQVAVMNN